MKGNYIVTRCHVLKQHGIMDDKPPFEFKSQHKAREFARSCAEGWLKANGIKPNERNLGIYSPWPWEYKVYADTKSARYEAEVFLRENGD